MIDFLCLLAGIGIGSFLTYYLVKDFHNTLQAIETKYQQLINIVSRWSTHAVKK